MLLWISFALLAAAVASLLLRRGAGDEAASDSGSDLAVYRDQLTELQSDAERGAIEAGEVSAARAEIARRVLRQAALDDAKVLPRTKTREASRAATDTILLAAAAAVPILSLGLYLLLGSPAIPGHPLAERVADAADTAAPNDMVAKVEAHLRDHPEDGKGWGVLAPIYLAQGRGPEAAMAYARALSSDGETPDRLLGLLKANIVANKGIVNEPARKAAQRLVDLGGTHLIEAKYWLAFYDEQNGRPDAAAAAYLTLLASGPADAPWRKAVEERLAVVTGKAVAPAISAPAPGGVTPPVLSSAAGVTDGSAKGPTPAEFVAAAQKLAPEMRAQMIGRMISKASDAVKQNPKDVSAWSRLVTGQTALGKSSEAKSALKDAMQALQGETAALTELDALSKSLGLNS